MWACGAPLLNKNKTNCGAGWDILDPWQYTVPNRVTRTWWFDKFQKPKKKKSKPGGVPLLIGSYASFNLTWCVFKGGIRFAATRFPRLWSHVEQHRDAPGFRYGAT